MFMVLELIVLSRGLKSYSAALQILLLISANLRDQAALCGCDW
jgi:hypothetical protein